MLVLNTSGVLRLLKLYQALKKCQAWDFPGGPVAKTLCFQCRGIGSIPGQGTKIPHAVLHSQKKMPDSNTVTKIIMTMADTYGPLQCALY